MTYLRCILKPGKDKPLIGRHPWVFSGAINEIDESCAKGDLLEIYSAEGEYRGTGYFNPESQLSVRILSFKKRPIDTSFFQERLKRALEIRRKVGLPSSSTDSFRLVHAEADGLPGLIVDFYAGYAVVQILTAGMEKFKGVITDILVSLLSPKGIFEKSPAEFRSKEGLLPAEGCLVGEPVPDLVEIRENGQRFYVDLKKGQKTGFFLDQRDNRDLVKSVSAGANVLNCFSYTGGFSVFAAAGGASSVISVDASAYALELSEKNMALNGFGAVHSAVQADVFEYLRQEGEAFDLIVLDPPAFCKNKSHVDAAARGYKDINLCALKRLRQGGFFYTASCSSHISADLFQKILFAAAKDAGRELRILSKTSHPADHPVSIYHPEGEYLKGLLCIAD